mmetsp:Transcript_42441/g.133059  ORF Transcript_42441/g.133059 Transcript_42441/m.133059 type:complete len:186 (-) Transcript_42441:555-1112(-)
MAERGDKGNLKAAHKKGKDEIARKLPRYLRVNTLRISVKAAVKQLRKCGHELIKEPKNRSGAHRRQRPQKKVDPKSFRLDPHVPGLLVFQRKGRSDISRIPLLRSGDLVAQQKASCFPPLALLEGVDVKDDAAAAALRCVDGCAAPGSKTSFLATLMRNRGEVFWAPTLTLTIILTLTLSLALPS